MKKLKKIICELFGHNWMEIEVERVQDWGFLFHQTCKRCGEKKRVTPPPPAYIKYWIEKNQGE